MRKLKIVLVGGGSFRWTPRLVCNILENASLNGSYVVLYDINSQALELTGKLSEKYRALYKSDTTFAHTTDQAEALEGADAVVVTLSTGGLEAMQQDLKIPETFGIFHTVGDTIGPAGLSRSLRKHSHYARPGARHGNPLSRCLDAQLLQPPLSPHPQRNLPDQHQSHGRLPRCGRCCQNLR